MGFLGGLVVKNLPVNAGDTSSILGLRRSPGGGHGNLLQYSYLEKPMDRGVLGFGLKSSLTVLGGKDKDF